MKKRFFKRVAAFVTASLMALGLITAIPEDYRRILGTEVSAEEDGAAVSGELHSEVTLGSDFESMTNSEEEVSISAYADDIVASGYCGNTAENGGKNVTWVLNNNGLLTISGIGNMENCSHYTDVSYNPLSPWRSNNLITSVIIESGVTSIGDDAFNDCRNLTSITIPNSVTSIGNWAFLGCTGLTSVVIPDSITSIGTSAFLKCTNLTNITIPNSVISINMWAFDGCDNLIIYGYSNTVAETYAKENNIPFVALDDNNTEITYNYHGYKLFDDSMTWDEAKAYCESLGGHLLTISSADEQAMVTSLAQKSTKKNIWLGAELISDNFVWITGEPFDYTNWNTGEPNNVKNAQNTIMMYTYSGENSNGYAIVPGKWNDESKNGRDWSGYTISDTGFICEWDSMDEFGNTYTATMTPFTDPVNVGDELLFNVVIRDSNGNPVKLSDMVIEPTFTTSVSDTSCIRIDSESTNETGAFIQATAIGEGTATVTVTFGNGVSAKSTVTVGKSEIGDDDTDTSSDSRYDDLYLKFTPANLSYTYNADKGEFNVESTECSISLACIDLLQTGKFMDIDKVVVTPPKGFRINGLDELTPLVYTYDKPSIITGTSDGDLSEKFVLYPPTNEFLEGNPLTESYKAKMKITVYGDNGFVKTFEQNIPIKYIADASEPVPYDAIVIDENHSVNDDIIVKEGQYVVISSKYGDRYKAEINCDNLYVKGGTCKIVGTATLNVKGNAEVTGGKTNWLNLISLDTEGGVLEVDGKLNVNGNMLVGTDCGILNMTKSGSTVDVKGDFKITTNSTKYTCNLSDGILKIGGNFESSGKYSGNFQASGNHLTLFYGNDFNITIDKSKAFFNNLSFTESAVNSVTYQDKLLNFKLYTSNVKGKFYLYKANKNLSYLFSDYFGADKASDILMSRYEFLYQSTSLDLSANLLQNTEKYDIIKKK